MAMPSKTLVLWPTAVVLLVTRRHPASAVCAAAPLTLIPLPTPTHWLPLGGHRRSVPRERAARTRTRWRRRCRTTSRTTPSRSVGFGAPAPRCALRACWPRCRFCAAWVRESNCIALAWNSRARTHAHSLEELLPLLQEYQGAPGFGTSAGVRDALARHRVSAPRCSKRLALLLTAPHWGCGDR